MNIKLHNQLLNYKFIILLKKNIKRIFERNTQKIMCVKIFVRTSRTVAVYLKPAYFSNVLYIFYKGGQKLS